MKNPGAAAQCPADEDRSVARVDADASAVTTAAPVATPTRALRWGSLLALAAWGAALLVMATSSANPITLNRDQIAHSSSVVTARVLNRSTGEIEILKDWRRPDDPGRKAILQNLDRAGARDGQQYLMPLTKRPDATWQVTETRLPNGRPLIYPDTPAAQQVLTSLLRELTANRVEE